MPRIIMIDDDVEFIELVDDALMARGCTISYADGGDDGIRLARRLQPEMILLDLMMPGVDGYGVAAAIRDDPQLKYTLIVAVTGLAKDGAEAQLRAAGFDGCIEKSAELDTFISQIERFLERPLGPAEADV